MQGRIWELDIIFPSAAKVLQKSGTILTMEAQRPLFDVTF